MYSLHPMLQVVYEKTLGPAAQAVPRGPSPTLGSNRPLSLLTATRFMHKELTRDFRSAGFNDTLSVIVQMPCVNSGEIPM